MKTLTIETLKENKTEIVNYITDVYGAPYVQEVMQEMINTVFTTEQVDVIEFVIEVANNFNLDVKGSRKEIKMESILGKLNEMEIENN